jgi:hypothetical protein
MIHPIRRARRWAKENPILYTLLIMTVAILILLAIIWWLGNSGLMDSPCTKSAEWAELCRDLEEYTG